MASPVLNGDASVEHGPPNLTNPLIHRRARASITHPLPLALKVCRRWWKEPSRRPGRPAIPYGTTGRDLAARDVARGRRCAYTSHSSNFRSAASVISRGEPACPRRQWPPCSGCWKTSASCARSPAARGAGFSATSVTWRCCAKARTSHPVSTSYVNHALQNVDSTSPLRNHLRSRIKLLSRASSLVAISHEPRSTSSYTTTLCASISSLSTPRTSPPATSRMRSPGGASTVPSHSPSAEMTV